MDEIKRPHQNNPRKPNQRLVRAPDGSLKIVHESRMHEVKQAKAEIDENWLAIDISNQSSKPRLPSKLRPKGSEAVKVISEAVQKALPQLKPTAKRLWRNRISRIVILCIAAFIILNMFFWQIGSRGGPGPNDGTTASDSADEPAIPELSFTPVLPEGDITKTTSGKLSRFADREGASFTDFVNEVEVTVSEQPLPANFAGDPDGSVEKLAKEFNANERLDLVPGYAYLGTSIKGPQTVVMRVNNVLIFVNSPKTIPNLNWVQYLKTLRPL